MMHIFFFSILSFFALRTGIDATEPTFTLPHRGCYYSIWSVYRPGRAQFLPHDVDVSLCTIFYYAFAEIKLDSLADSASLAVMETAKKLTALKRKNSNLKMIISVGGWGVSPKFSELAASPDMRKSFIVSVVRTIRDLGFDGLDVGWEYPGKDDFDYFTDLITDIRAEFDAEAKRSAAPRLILTAAVGNTTRPGYNIPLMARAFDLLNVMSYNLQTPFSEVTETGHPSQLFPPSTNSTLVNVRDFIEDWEKVGIPKSKIVVGLAAFGNTWKLVDVDEFGLNVSAAGPAAGGFYTKTPGFLAYYEICEKIRSGELTPVLQSDIQSPYAYSRSGKWWVGYDDAASIREKVKWTKYKGYSGVFVWEMTFDDFFGNCGTKYPLLNAIKEEFKNDEEAVSFPEAVASTPASKISATTERIASTTSVVTDVSTLPQSTISRTQSTRIASTTSVATDASTLPQSTISQTQSSNVLLEQKLATTFMSTSAHVDTSAANQLQSTLSQVKTRTRIPARTPSAPSDYDEDEEDVTFKLKTSTSAPFRKLQETSIWSLSSSSVNEDTKIDLTVKSTTHIPTSVESRFLQTKAATSSTSSDENNDGIVSSTESSRTISTLKTEQTSIRVFSTSSVSDDYEDDLTSPTKRSTTATTSKVTRTTAQTFSTTSNNVDDDEDLVSPLIVSTAKVTKIRMNPAQNFSTTSANDDKQNDTTTESTSSIPTSAHRSVTQAPLHVSTTSLNRDYDDLIYPTGALITILTTSSDGIASALPRLRHENKPTNNFMPPEKKLIMVPAVPEPNNEADD